VVYEPVLGAKATVVSRIILNIGCERRRQELEILKLTMTQQDWRALKQVGIALMGAGALLLAVNFRTLISGPQPPPLRQSLITFSGSLSEPVSEESDRGKGWARIVVDGTELKIHRLCDLWNCHLPSDIATLGPGTGVSGLRLRDEIVELTSGTSVLVSYEQWVGAGEAQVTRAPIVSAALAIFGLLLAVLSHKRAQ